MAKIKIAFGDQKPEKDKMMAKNEMPSEPEDEEMDDEDYSFVDVMRLLKDRLEGDDTEAALNIVNEFITENAPKRGEKESGDLKKKIAGALSSEGTA